MSEPELPWALTAAAAETPAQTAPADPIGSPTPTGSPVTIAPPPDPVSRIRPPSSFVTNAPPISTAPPVTTAPPEPVTQPDPITPPVPITPPEPSPRPDPIITPTAPPDPIDSPDPVDPPALFSPPDPINPPAAQPPPDSTAPGAITPLTPPATGTPVPVPADSSGKRPFKMAFYYNLEAGDPLDVVEYVQQTLLPAAASLLGRWLRVRTFLIRPQLQDSPGSDVFDPAADSSTRAPFELPAAVCNW